MELTVRDAMQLGDLRRAKLVAGSDGLSNIVRHVSVIEVPDAYRWFKGYERRH
jgi:purine catabolism regulator